MRARVSWLGAAAVVLAAGLAYPPPPESPLVPKKVGKRFDAPDLAEAWYRQRREATPGGPTPERAYRLAHRRRATMDRYSTRRGARSEGGRFERAAAAAPAPW